MAPTRTKRTVSGFLYHHEQIPLSESPWHPMPGKQLSQIPWRWSKPTHISPPPSPPRPPCPTRPPPPIPTVSRRIISVSEAPPERELPPKVLASLMASLESANDINNLRQNARSSPKDARAIVRSPETVADQFGKLYSTPSALRMIETHHSHHTSEHSAGHRHTFNGGGYHKASVASSGNLSRELMTTEEKMSEADEFFATDDDDDSRHVLGTVAIAAAYGVGETPDGNILDGFGQVVEHPSKKIEGKK